MPALTAESRPPSAPAVCAHLDSAAALPADASTAWPLRRQLARVTFAWMFGAIWFNVITGAPIVAFAKGLGASYFQFGLLAAIPYVAALFTVPGSLLAERHGGRKSIFLRAHYLQRGLCIAVAVLPVTMLALYGRIAAPHAVTLTLLLMFLMHATGAIGGPAWVSWMADVVPKRIRGAYFARRRQWGIVAAIPAALATGWGLQHFAGGGVVASPLAGVPPIVFWGAVLIAVTALFGLADIVLFRPLPHTPRPPRQGAGLMQSLAAPMKDRVFMTLSLFVGAINFTVGFTNQFAMIYVIDRMGIDHVQSQLMLLVAPMLLQWAMLPAWGAAVDRMGRKPLLLIAATGMAPIAFGWCIMGQMADSASMAWLGYLLFAGGAALWTGVEVVNFNWVLNAGGRAGALGGSGYHAVNTVIINVAGCGGGLVAGLIARGMGDWTWQPIAALRPIDFYGALFALSGTVRVLALLAIAPLIVEPTAKSVRATLLFLASHTGGTALRHLGALKALFDRDGEPLPPAVIATLQPADPSSEVRPAA